MHYVQQSQRGQSYTMSTHDEWLGGLHQTNAPGENTFSIPTPTPTSDLQLGLLDSQLEGHPLEPVDFTDSLCNMLGLNAKYRSDLHTFLTLITDRPDTDIIPMVYLMATNLYTQQLILDSRTDYAAIAEVLNDVKIALAQNLDLSKEQRFEVTLCAKIKVGDPKRVDFDNDAIRVAVYNHLKKHEKSNGFEPIFKSPARIRALNQFIGLQASYAKSIYRTFLKDSGTMCATIATTRGMQKMSGSTENITPVNAMRMIILRQLVRDNKDLFPEPGASSNKRARVGDSDTTQKSTRGTEVDSWWPKVTTFLEEKNKQWTTDLKSPGWTQYINQIIAHERRIFPNDLIPLIPKLDSGSREYRPSSADRPMRPIDRGYGHYHLPPLQLKDGSSTNSLLLPAPPVSAAGRYSGPLQGSSTANQVQVPYYDASSPFSKN